MPFLKKTFLFVALSFLATLGLYVVAIGNSDSEPHEKYIDMHTHVACAGAEKPTEDTCYVEPKMKNSFKYRAYRDAFGVTEEELKKNDFAVFDSLIKKVKSSKRLKGAVVLSLDGVINKRTGEMDWKKTQFYVPGSYVLQALKTRASGVLYYGASVNPYRKDAIERLVQAKNDGAVLIKWIPSIMYIDPSDPQLVDFYKKMVELDLVLLTHTGKESSFNDSLDQLADPMRLLLPLNLGVKIIAAHVATTGSNEGEADFDRLAKLMKSEKYKNQLFTDI